MQIRDVPEAVRLALATEAERRGQSLQLYLSEVLEREAASARNLAWLRERASAPRRPSPATTRDGIRDDWEGRDRRVLGREP